MPVRPSQLLRVGLYGREVELCVAVGADAQDVVLYIWPIVLLSERLDVMIFRVNRRPSPFR